MSIDKPQTLKSEPQNPSSKPYTPKLLPTWPKENGKPHDANPVFLRPYLPNSN